MNIWMIRQYATVNSRTHALAKELVSREHTATIFAAGFNHNTFSEEHLQPGEKYRIEEYDAVRFVWLRVMPYTKNDWRRSYGIVQFTLRAILAGMKIKESPDVIIGTCVHHLAPLAAYILAKRKRAEFIYELNDAWPQSLIYMGYLSANSLIAKSMVFLLKFLVRRAKKVISILPHVDDYLEELGLGREKFVWIPNPVQPELFENIEPYSGADSKPFIVEIITSFPVDPMGLDNVLEAAKFFQDEGNTKIQFVFVGDGRTKKQTVELSEKLGLKNVKFTGWVPKEELYKPMNEAAVFMSLLDKRDTYRFGIALNKLYTYFMGARPIIYAGESKNRPVDDAEAGITIPPRDTEAMIRAIKELMAMSPEQIKQMGINGREYALKYHNISVSTDKLESVCLAN